MTRLLRRLRDLFAPASRDREIAQELQLHLESLVREYRESGLSEEAAEQAARRRFGSVASIKDRGHDVRGAGWLEDWLRELRHAARRLVRTPAFTLATVATLALAIGANAAIFTLVHRVVLNPLPYPESDRLIELSHGFPRINVPTGIGMTVGLYHHYLDRARTLERVAIYQTGEATLTGSGEPERIRVARATTTLGPALRVAPALGRWFTDEEGVPGAPQAAVLSHGLWARRYGADPGVLGRSATVNGVPTEVVGVMPASFAFPDPGVDIWLPVQVTRAAGFGLPYSYVGLGRLRAGASVADARREIDSLIGDLRQAFPGDPGVVGNTGEGGLMSAARTLKELTVGGIERAAWILFAAVGLVLLVACANVANLFLVRAEVREREVAVRRALGAGHAGIARLFLAESALLSLAGGLLGVALAFGGVQLLVSFGPATLPRLDEVRLDGVVAAFATGLSLLAALVLGAMPLVRGARPPVAAALHERGRSNTAGRRRHRMRHLLMGGQVALALVLLAASGLMVRSFQHLRQVDPGFDPSSALTFRIGLPARDYPTRQAGVAAHQAILDRLAQLPNVTAVSASTGLPLAMSLGGGCFGNTILVQGRVLPAGTTPPVALICAVAGGYVEAMGLRLLRGRSLDRGDVERRETVVLASKSFADAVFADADAIGARVRSNAPPGAAARPPDGAGVPVLDWEGAPPWLTIVGVVSDTPDRALDEANPLPKLYIPMSIAGGPDIPPIAMLGPNIATVSYVVRTATSPLGLTPAVRQAVAVVDRNLAIAQVRTLDDMLDAAAAQMAFTMALLAIAASVALLLGLVGIYGVVSYIVSQRTSEIGVRLALGAEPGGVAAMIVRQGGLVSLAGVAVGLAAALAGSRLIESLLYEVSPRDPVVFGVTALTLLGVALLACWLPARRAARVSPVEALRAD